MKSLFPDKPWGGLPFDQLDPAIFGAALFSAVAGDRRQGAYALTTRTVGCDAVLAHKGLHQGLGAGLGQLEVQFE